MVKEINVKRHIAVLAIVSLVFIIGVFLGMRQGFDAVQGLGEDYESMAMSSAMIDSVFLMEEIGMNSSESCEAYTELFERFNSDISQFNHRMWEMEERLGKDNPSLLSLKDKFNTLEVRNYLLLKKMDRACGANHTAILYFYSNKNYDPERDQGKVLQETIDNNTIVYHFDTDISNPSVEMLIKHHMIFVAPSMVINDTVYSGYQDKEKLEQILCCN